VAEEEDRGFVRCGGYAQIHSGKEMQHSRLIERFFHAGIGQAEPLLQKVSPQDDRQANQLPALG